MMRTGFADKRPAPQRRDRNGEGCRACAEQSKSRTFLHGLLLQCLIASLSISATSSAPARRGLAGTTAPVPSIAPCLSAGTTRFHDPAP